MIKNDDDHLLFIEPIQPPSPAIDDELTRALQAAWNDPTRRTSSTYGYRGAHSCTAPGCSAASDNLDHWIDGLLTNSLCMHYVRYHRREIPALELVRLRLLLSVPLDTYVMRHERVVDDVIYYTIALTAEEWDTGPCLTRNRALGRAAAYWAGMLISEAAPGQFSRRELREARNRLADESEGAILIDLALEAGLHSDAWIRASAYLSALYRRSGGLPREIKAAGGIVICRRRPESAMITITEGLGVWPPEQIAALGLSGVPDSIEFSDALHARGYWIVRAERLDGKVTAQVTRL